MIREDLYFGTIVLAVSTLPSNSDFMYFIGIFLAGIFGAMLRVGIQLGRKSFTWSGFAIQMMITIPVCYFAYNIWLQYKLTYQLQTYLFAVSFMSLYIATLLDRIGRIGFYEVAQSLLRRIMAISKDEGGIES